MPLTRREGQAQNPHWRCRDREWSWFAAALVAVCLLQAVWPTLDLQVSALAHVDGRGFVADQWPWVRAVYVAVPWVGRGLALLALAVLLLHAAGLPAPALRWRRRLALLGLALLLGVGGMVNGVFKESWGRARPISVQAFGGTAEFSPALRPARACRTNCSFVSGHAATGFVLGAIGLLGAPATRRRWLLIGAAAGLLLGSLRIAQGAHFLTDVLFCGVVVWGCNLALRALWLRVALRRRRRRRAQVSEVSTSRRASARNSADCIS